MSKEIQKAQQKEHMKSPVKKDESEVKQKDVTEEVYVEPLETSVIKEDCDLESKIDIDEDKMFKTESADLSEFVQETNEDSVDIMTGHVDDDDESRRKEEEEEEFSNRVTIEEFLPHLSGSRDYMYY